MFETVRNNFEEFSVPMEGKVPYMYQDHLGKVTVGIGNLIDSEQAAWETRNAGAPFVVKRGGSEADEATVKAEWQRVKTDPSLTGDHTLARDATTLELTPEGITALLQQRLRDFEGILLQTPEFAELDAWPADAQLGLLSMAWAMGPAFAQGSKWPKFRQACAATQWSDAARHSVMKDTWLVRRNAVNRGLFRNAHWASSQGEDLTALYIAIPGNRPPLEKGVSDEDHAAGGFDSADSVSSLQRSLAWLEFYSGEVTGTFDDATDESVRAFQASENELTATQGGFAVDGKVGPTTWAALGFVVPRN